MTTVQPAAQAARTTWSYGLWGHITVTAREFAIDRPGRHDRTLRTDITSVQRRWVFPFLSSLWVNHRGGHLYLRYVFTPHAKEIVTALGL